jgi:hypothetical protein
MLPVVESNAENRPRLDRRQELRDIGGAISYMAIVAENVPFHLEVAVADASGVVDGTLRIGIADEFHGRCLQFVFVGKARIVATNETPGN